MKTRAVMIGTILLLTLVGALVFSMARSGAVRPGQLARCFPETGDRNFNAQCLRASVVDLLSRMSTRDLLAYTMASSTPLSVRNQCHALAHAIGVETYQKTKRVDAALAECSDTCRNGCKHGVIGAAVLAELGTSYEDDLAHYDVGGIMEVGSGYCAQSRDLCHAIGHLLFIGQNAYEPALAACDSTSTGGAQRACYGGVFMESAGMHESLFFAQSVQSSGKEGDLSPCDTVPRRYQGTCLRYLPMFQESRLLRSGGKTPLSPETTTRSCASLEKGPRAECFEGIGRNSEVYGIATHRASYTELCGTLKMGDDRSACVTGSVDIHVEYIGWRSAMKYCNSVEEEPVRKRCYEAGFGAMERTEGISRVESFCEAVKGACDGRFKAYKENRPATQSIHDSTLENGD